MVACAETTILPPTPASRQIGVAGSRNGKNNGFQKKDSKTIADYGSDATAYRKMNAERKTSMPSQNLNSFKAVFERHFDEVYGYVAYRVAPDLEEAKDLTQEVFLAALKAWGTYRGDASPLTWLRSIARRKIADHFMARAQQNSAKGAVSLTNVMNGHSDLDEGAAILSRAMRQLPLDRVELLEEKYLEGRSVRQIANQRGISEKAVESALSRAREALRDQFLRFQAIEETSNERQ